MLKRQRLYIVRSFDENKLGNYRNPEGRRNQNQGITEGFPEEVALVRAERWVEATR